MVTGQSNRPEFEPLEPRLMLDGQSQTLQLFSASPALFVENQGQWADTAIHHGFDGAGCAIAFREQRPASPDLNM